MAKQYVQHISGQGAKWEVAGVERPSWMEDGTRPNENEWLVCEARYHAPAHLLPKSEYVLCEPPADQWQDVTEACVLDECGAIMHNGVNTFADERYRRRKVQLGGKAHALSCAVIIEQQVTGQ